ncbi:MAG TPA: CHRD domain-containing protein [Candidatus Eisenbacteria bacterium]|nr:CHRD domain-containing protein [Candidatus Eisenbacteria bacterium]
MKVLVSAMLLAFTFFLALGSTVAQAETIQATLTGYEEVPSVSTGASGEFRGFISRNDDSITYELSYSGLEGTVTQAHIHFGQRSVNGSIVVWLCQTATNPSPVVSTPLCPTSGTVTGTITAADVIATSTASQRILAGELAEVIAAIRAGAGYVNVHSTPLTTGGEIRGQIRASAKR